MNDLRRYLFYKLVCANEEYRKGLPCICEEMADRMTGRWTCPEHGFMEPNYQAIFEAEEREALEKKIMAAEARMEGER